MALSMGVQPFLEPIRSIYGPADAGAERAPKAEALNASMRSRARLIRRTEFQLDNTRKRVALMERMIADFDCIVANLDREIVIEQERARIYYPAHFAYPTYAKAAILRRDNLKRSADELRAQLAKARRRSQTWLLDANTTVLPAAPITKPRQETHVGRNK